MNYNAIIVILIGIAVCLFPKYIREYKAYEWGEEKSSTFIRSQRITGVVFIILGIILLFFGIE